MWVIIVTTAVLIAGAAALVTEFFMSLSVQVKLGKWWRNSLIWKVCAWFVRLIKKILKKVFGPLASAVGSQAGDVLRSIGIQWKLCLGAAAALIFNVIAGYFGFYNGGWLVLGFFVDAGIMFLVLVTGLMLRRLEKNRFLFVFEKRDLDDAVSNKFSLLEDVHRIASPTGLAASVSIGLGVDGSCFEESYNFASLALEMALSRGGDQAVIKNRLNFTFFGGRSVEADYTSKVRSRVTASSLMELIGQSSRVFVMGHRTADLDSLGAAMGICCMCRKKGKQASIVIDLEKNSAQRLIKEVQKVPEYDGVFLSGQEAMVACDNGSILVVVDTNRPDQVEWKPLLEAIGKVCVVDHHRRAADYISPVVVNLHETYASSASELVTELITYAVDSSDVLAIEAKALLAGICMDTKFFNVRSGERTFEAAAALRRMGADTTDVKLLMQNDFHDTVTKYQIVKSARLYRGELAIAALNYTVPRPLAAQAADEMLNIAGITASFVLFPDENQVIISARSIGRVNVQVILEPLGGGGNAMVAGAQVKELDVKQTLDRLVESIDQFYEG